jgi:sulfonate transport system permease protein
VSATEAATIETRPGPVGDEPIELVRPSPTGRAAREHHIRVPRLARRSVGLLVVLAAWQLSCSLGVFTPEEVPSPGDVWQAATQLWSQGTLQSAIWISLRRVLEGLALGVGAGVILAVLTGFFRVAEDLLDPVLQAVRAVPLLGLLPLFIVWFGVGEAPKVYLIALGCVFPVYINTYGGIRGVDSKLVEVGQTFGLSRLGLIVKIILPGALPGFLIGLRFALVSSWVVVIVAEQINAQSGLGYLIMQAQNTNRTDIMFLGLSIYAVLGLIADALVRLLEGRLLSWRRGFTGS